VRFGPRSAFDGSFDLPLESTRAGTRTTTSTALSAKFEPRNLEPNWNLEPTPEPGTSN
jgi:hypothetical protein